MLKEFKEFAFKGNLIDMAVGIVIGAAFTTVVKSLVDDIVMPLIGLLTNGVDFSDRFAVLKDAPDKPDAIYTTIAAAKEAGATVLSYGSFISAFISFLIVTFVLFIIIKKVIGAIEGNLQQTEAPAAAPEPTPEIKLLTEIRDLLKAK